MLGSYIHSPLHLFFMVNSGHQVSRANSLIISPLNHLPSHSSAQSTALRPPFPQHGAFLSSYPVPSYLLEVLCLNPPLCPQCYPLYRIFLLFYLFKLSWCFNTYLDLTSILGWLVTSVFFFLLSVKFQYGLFPPTRHFLQAPFPVFLIPTFSIQRQMQFGFLSL